MRPTQATEFTTGTLFGDQELVGLLDSLRASMYEPIAGLTGEMSSPYNVGLSTGAPSADGASQSSVEGLLTLDPEKLSAAIASNPAGVQQMLQQWSLNVQQLVNNAAEPGGTIEGRTRGDGEQVTQLTSRINSLNEQLALREKALQATYAELESVISKNSAQSSWLSQQSEALAKSGG